MNFACTYIESVEIVSTMKTNKTKNNKLIIIGDEHELRPEKW